VKVCYCESPSFDYRDYEITDLGMDSNYADISISICKKCGSRWLKYLIEEEYYSKSGRWWRVKLDLPKIDTEAAKEYIENQTSCFIGGSYFGHGGQLFDGGAIKIR